MSIALIAHPPRGSSGASPVAAAPTPADDIAPTPTPSAPPGFAELLRRNRAEAMPPVPPAPVDARAPAAEKSPAREDAAQDPPSLDAKAPPANAAKARAATRATGKAVVENGGRGSETACRDDAARRVAGRSEADVGASAVAASAGEPIDGRPTPFATDTPGQPPRTTPAAIDDEPGSSALPHERPSAGAAAPRPGLGHARGMAAVDAANERPISAAEASRDQALRAAADTGFPVALADAGLSDDHPAVPSVHERASDALAASLAAGTSAHGAAAMPAASAPIATSLATPVAAPDFATALGVKVSMLTQGGVQQAELHLNPAEMGPVSIHISLDGSAARVEFGADVAATREAIERGLPELASALRDAGFTLAGGGVSQHAGGRAAGEDSAAGTARRPDAGGAQAPTATAAAPGRAIGHVRAGGVDLYA